MLSNKKVLMIMAHPDDEIIFGWAIFQDKSIEKKLLICSSDFYNKEREWCKYRKNALFEICKELNIEVSCLDYPSSFYRVATRRPPHLPKNEYGDSQSPIRSLSNDIINNMLAMEKDCDYVFTHNPYGEYGHLDHKFLFDLVVKNTKKDIVISDIQISSNWSKNYNISGIVKKIYYYRKIKDQCVLNQDLLSFCKKKYENKNGWTWNRHVPSNCNLFLLENNKE